MDRESVENEEEEESNGRGVLILFSLQFMFFSRDARPRAETRGRLGNSKLTSAQNTSVLYSVPAILYLA